MNEKRNVQLDRRLGRQHKSGISEINATDIRGHMTRRRIRDRARNAATRWRQTAGSCNGRNAQASEPYDLIRRD